jgi:maltose-binding protein MalE
MSNPEQSFREVAAFEKTLALEIDLDQNYDGEANWVRVVFEFSTDLGSTGFVFDEEASDYQPNAITGSEKNRVASMVRSFLIANGYQVEPVLDDTEENEYPDEHDPYNPDLELERITG